jgi:hypothetical protein
MLFMGVLTWKAEKRNEVLARRFEKGLVMPEGVKLVGEWGDLCGHRDFVLIETDNPAGMMLNNFGWSDIMDMEAVPVMDAEEMLKLFNPGK